MTNAQFDALVQRLERRFARRPREARELTALMDELRSAIRCRVDRVLLTADFNASVQQVPRLGLFGWSRRYLLIGLPLLEVLSREELRVVLAHEFAHLSAEHG